MANRAAGHLPRPNAFVLVMGGILDEAQLQANCPKSWSEHCEGRRLHGERSVHQCCWPLALIVACLQLDQQRKTLARLALTWQECKVLARQLGKEKESALHSSPTTQVDLSCVRLHWFFHWSTSALQSPQQSLIDFICTLIGVEKERQSVFIGSFAPAQLADLCWGWLGHNLFSWLVGRSERECKLFYLSLQCQLIFFSR